MRRVGICASACQEGLEIVQIVVLGTTSANDILGAGWRSLDLRSSPTSAHSTSKLSCGFCSDLNHGFPI